MIGVYWESWSTDSLRNCDPNVDIIYLAFADPNLKHQPGSFSGSGLEFTTTFASVQGDIKFLQSRGQKVMLSVGGSSGVWNQQFTGVEVGALASDMGCDGIDIDWEPATGVGAAAQFGLIIAAISKVYSGKLSAACWSTGAYGPATDGSDIYKGMNIPGLVDNGSLLSWINIMAYDAGNDYDPLGAYDCYRIYYKGPIYLGLEVGVMGWGPHLLTVAEVTNDQAYVKPGDGFFIWSYHKTGTPSVGSLISMLKSVASAPAVTPPPQILVPPATTFVRCTCGKVQTISFT